MSGAYDDNPSAANVSIPSPSPSAAAVPPELAARLAARRRWFRSFPDGSLEFVAAIRIVWILAFFAAPVIGGFLQVYATLAIGAVLLLDFGLVMTWLVRITADRDAWARRGTAENPAGARSGASLTAIALIAQALLLAFLALSFLRLPLEIVRTHPGVANTARWVLLAAYAVAAVATARSCRSAGLRSRASGILLAAPLLSWWALRRFARDVAAPMTNEVQVLKKPPHLSGAGFVMADAAWLAALVVSVAVVLLARNMGMHATWQNACSGILLAVAAIADVAALESVQRVYLGWLRTVQPARPRDAGPG